MMPRRVTAIRVPPGCLESVPVREYDLSEPMDTSLMRRLAEGGSIQYFPHFPRPFFRIDRPGAFSTQGIVGASTLRVTFSPRSTNTTREELRALLEGSENPAPAKGE